MSNPNVSQEAVEEAISSVNVLLEAMRGRIADLKMIWRRQRMDVDTQIRYYANGLLEDYYRVRWYPFIKYFAENCPYLVRNTARSSLTPTWRISENRPNGALRTNGRRRTELRILRFRTTRPPQGVWSQVSDWRSSLIY